MFVDQCIFVDGRHVWAGKHCPHGMTQDEAGPIQQTGWTAQSNQ